MDPPRKPVRHLVVHLGEQRPGSTAAARRCPRSAGSPTRRRPRRAAPPAGATGDWWAAGRGEIRTLRRMYSDGLSGSRYSPRTSGLAPGAAMRVELLGQGREPVDAQLGDEEGQVGVPLEHPADHQGGEEDLRALGRLQDRQEADQARVLDVGPAGMDHRRAHPDVEQRHHAQLGGRGPDRVEAGCARRDAAGGLRGDEEGPTPPLPHPPQLGDGPVDVVEAEVGDGQQPVDVLADGVGHPRVHRLQGLASEDRILDRPRQRVAAPADEVLLGDALLVQPRHPGGGVDEWARTDRPRGRSGPRPPR